MGKPNLHIPRPTLEKRKMGGFDISTGPSQAGAPPSQPIAAAAAAVAAAAAAAAADAAAAVACTPYGPADTAALLREPHSKGGGVQLVNVHLPLDDGLVGLH